MIKWIGFVRKLFRGGSMKKADRGEDIEYGRSLFKRPAWRNAAGLVLVVVLGALISGCNKEPTAEERFTEYIGLWNKQKFADMYKYLTDDAKQKISEEDFTNRYQKIYDDLQITDLKIDFKKPNEDKKRAEGEAQFSFSAQMNSVAGPIRFDYEAKLQEQEKDKKKNWFVDWNTGFIFPKMKEGDTLRLSTVPAKRGEIVDRNGTGLAVNGQVYEVGVVAGEIDDAVLEPLSGLLKMSKEQIQKALGASWVKPGLFVPLKKVPMDDADRIAQLVALEPVQTKKVEGRIYPLGEAAAQLTGYVGPITADELEKRKDKGYTAQDVIGKRGLEQVFDEQLKGESGVKIIVKKKDGSDEVLAEKPVVDGKDIKLTIDADLQEVVFAEMGSETGTSAAMNPGTGEVLALVSSPAFDPNQAALGLSADEWKVLQEDERNPLLTRFSQVYAPGSVMKPVTAAVALGAGSLKADKTVEISGKKWQKDPSWGGYFVTRVHEASPVNLENALVYSDNIYFAQAALGMGKDAFADGLRRFGFEEKSGFAYPLETSRFGGLDSDIMLADSGYGQGQVEMSVVHLLAAYTPFANGDGSMVKPILLDEEKRGQVWKEGVVSVEDAGMIAADLRKVVGDAEGTAHAAEIAGYPLSGKTGTAEIKQKQGETGTENGWFIAYNTESPNLMIATMVEGVEGRGGSGIPVKIVKNIYTRLR